MALSLRFPSVAVSNCHALCCPDFPPRINTRRLANNLALLVYSTIGFWMYTTIMKHRPRNLLLLTLGWLIMAILTVAVLINNPECPEYYTQAQIDAEGCIVGANVGAGILVQFVMLPLTAILVVGWWSSLFNKTRKTSNKH